MDPGKSADGTGDQMWRLEKWFYLVEMLKWG